MQRRPILILLLMLSPLAWADSVDVYKADTVPYDVGDFLVRGLGTGSQALNTSTDLIIWGRSGHLSDIPTNPPVSLPPPSTKPATGSGSDGTVYYWDGSAAVPGTGYMTVQALQTQFSSLGPDLDDFSVYIGVQEAGSAPEVTIDSIEFKIIKAADWAAGGLAATPVVTYSLDAFGRDNAVRLLNPDQGVSSANYEFNVAGGLHLLFFDPSDVVVMSLQMSELSSQGEVMWAANPSPLVGDFDMGDLPELSIGPGSYQTLLATGGPAHWDGSHEWLGATWDGEADGHPSIKATGDDLDASDDEDGVVAVPDQNKFLVRVSVSDTDPDGNPDPSWLERYAWTNLLGEEIRTDLYLSAWIDLNADGDFGDADEFIGEFQTNPADWGADAAPGVAGVQHDLEVPYAFPATGKLFYYSRWRLSFGHPVRPNGFTRFGEVEDSLIIPEPGSLLLLGAGLAVLARRRRRRSRR